MSVIMNIWRQSYQSICSTPVAETDSRAILDDHPARQFHRAWLELRHEAGGAMPKRDDITLSRFHQLMRWMFLFTRETTGGSERFKVVLAGTAVVELTHGDHTGQYLDEFTAGECYESRACFMRYVLRTGEPFFGKTAIQNLKSSEYRVGVNIGAFPLQGRSGEGQVLVLPSPQSAELRALL